MAFERECFARVNSHGGEEAPALEEASLSGRQAHFVDGHEAVVMEDEAMDHETLRGIIRGAYCTSADRDSEFAIRLRGCGRQGLRLR